MQTTLSGNRWIVALAFISLLVPTGLLAQSTLSVACVGPDGTPVRGVQVFLQAVNVREPEEKKTNKAGLANFKKVADGVYRVIARAEGMAPGLRDLILIRASSNPNESMTLVLKSGNPGQKFYFDDPAVLDRANQLSTDAIDDFGTNDLEAAEGKLKEALTLYPSSPFIHQNLGLLNLRLERWEEGEMHLLEAAHYMEIFALMGDPSMVQAREQVLAALEAIPLQKLAVEANLLMGERKYEEALPKFEEMRDMAPNNPDVYYNIALAQAHAGLIPGAKEAIAKALELRPSDTAYANLHDQVLQIERTGESLRAQQIVNSLEQLYNQGEYQAVLDRSRGALDELPEHSQANLWQLLGRTQLETAQYSDSIESYKKAISINEEKKSEILEELAGSLLNREQYDPAFEVYAEFYQASSRPADEGFYELASLLSNKGKPEESGKLLKRVLEIKPDHALAHYSIGMHYFYDKNDRPNAKTHLERFLELGQDPAKIDNAKSVLVVMEKTP